MNLWMDDLRRKYYVPENHDQLIYIEVHWQRLARFIDKSTERGTSAARPATTTSSGTWLNK